MRLAWFSPWPPQKSGVAGRSAEVVPLLASRGHAVDVFIDASRLKLPVTPADPPAAGGVRVMTAHDFLWRRAKGHYDLAVYQVGNSHLHRFIWPYMFRFPGMPVLHDARIHHARAEALLSVGRIGDYRTEFTWSHPAASPDGAEFAIQGFDTIFFYQWPMLRGVVESARMVAAHSHGVVEQIRHDWPDKPVEYIALGEGPANLDVAAARREFRGAHGLDDATIVFGVHGGLTAEKRVHDVLDAFARVQNRLSGARLLLVGAADPSLDLDGRIKRLGLTGAVCRVAAASDAEFDRAIAASDVTLNLRWPTAVETSGPWVRGMALGRPTVIVDSAHQAHVPALDPRTWRRHVPVTDLDPHADERAVTVALDMRDLVHSLGLAIRRLGTDAALRDRLGRNARAWWQREHTVDRMVLDYERAFARAVTLPDPVVSLPAHLRPEPSGWMHDLLNAPAWADPETRDRLAGI